MIKTYEEFMDQETFDGISLPEIGRYIWNSAIKSVVLELQQLRDEIAKEALSLELNYSDTTVVRNIADRLLQYSQNGIPSVSTDNLSISKFCHYHKSGAECIWGIRGCCNNLPCEANEKFRANDKLYEG
jgi:hypothetical protein